jgi:hypothetical protein
MYSVGFVAGCYFLGRLILREPRNRLLAFLVGWGILRVIGIVPVLGTVVSAAAIVYGLGCVTVAVFRARRGRASGEPPGDGHDVEPVEPVTPVEPLAPVGVAPVEPVTPIEWAAPDPAPPVERDEGPPPETATP